MAVPSYGAVLHTLNIRLFPEQVVYIVNHAEDGVIFVDGSLVEPLAKLAPQFAGVRHYVVMGDGDLDALPGAALLRGAARGGRRGRVRVARDRRARRGGALLHERHHRQPEGRALLAPLGRRCTRPTVCTADAVGLSSRDRVLAIVPMFHVNAWGLPFAAALTGAELLLPGPFLQGEPLARFVRGRARDAGGRRADRARRRCSRTSTSTAATSARCAAGSAAARPCRASSWRASSATACASCRRGG